MGRVLVVIPYRDDSHEKGILKCSHLRKCLVLPSRKDGWSDTTKNLRMAY